MLVFDRELFLKTRGDDEEYYRQGYAQGEHAWLNDVHGMSITDMRAQGYHTSLIWFVEIKESEQFSVNNIGYSFL